MANAFYATYGSCLRAKGGRPTSAKKNACYGAAKRAVAKLRPKRRRGKAVKARKCKFGRLKSPVRTPSGGKRYCKKKRG
jgi:hypothetical protein